MLLTDIRRISKTGFLDFWRNSVTSLAAILVFTITLSIIGGLILSTAVLNAELSVLREKVDIIAYINEDASETETLSLVERIEQLPEVSSASYLSKSQVLEDFKKKNEGDHTILQSLEELGENPLPAEVRVLAKEPSQYEGIARFLEGDEFLSINGDNIIDKVSYFDNKKAIDNITDFIVFIERLGIYISILFVIIAVIVAFNTIKLVIFNSREEIGVMRLVGAGNKYISGPFIVEGIMYGVISTIITLIMYYPITKWVSSSTNNFFGGINLFDYYIGNFLLISFVILVSGIFLGTISSYLAVKKYLKK